MNISGFKICRYRLPLVRPLVLGGRTVDVREGWLLGVSTLSGAWGWGEAAPLLGFSPEGLEEAGEALLRLAEGLPGTIWPASPRAMQAAIEAWLGDAEIPPSVRFAAELALAGVWAATHGETVTDLWGVTPADRVPINALLTEEDLETVEALRRIRAAGYRAVKMKVGGRPPEEEADRVRRVRAAVGEGVSLRLDANRAWSLDEALHFAQALGDTPLEYIEEPLRDPEGLPAFAEKTGYGVALDETLLQLEPEGLPAFGGVKALVLKPTLLGGLCKARRWAEAARRIGAYPVVSAAYEAGIGMRGLLALAAAQGPAGAPAGLDPYRRLARDVVVPRLPLDGPEVAVAPLLAQPIRLDKETVRTEVASEG